MKRASPGVVAFRTVTMALLWPAMLVVVALALVFPGLARWIETGNSDD